MFAESLKLLHKQAKKVRSLQQIWGRGTDIILGGNINFKIQKELYDILTGSNENATKTPPTTFCHGMVLTG
jgi:hypothetical protein